MYVLGIEQRTQNGGGRIGSLLGSEFSKGLLLVVQCRYAVNRPLISFKRIKGLTERLAGCTSNGTSVKVRNGSQV